MGKKAQFGPDALVGVVLLAVIGLGGIFFLNIFISSIQFQGILSILDSEVNQKCFYYALSVSGSDFIRAGSISEKKLKDDAAPEFYALKKYYGGFSNNEQESIYFKNKIYGLMKEYGLLELDPTIEFPSKIHAIDGMIGTASALGEWRPGAMGRKLSTGSDTQYCVIPVYSPSGTSGSLELVYSYVG